MAIELNDMTFSVDVPIDAIPDGKFKIKQLLTLSIGIASFLYSMEDIKEGGG